MSAAETYPTPENVVAEALHVTADDMERWEVQTPDAAEWALAKVRQAHCQYDDDTIAARNARDALLAEAERIDARIAERREERGRSVAFFEGRLIEWMRRLRREDPGRKSVKLAGGTIKSRAGRERVEVVDETRAATVGLDEGWATTVPKIDKRALLKYVKETGDVPAGVEFIEPGEDDVTFTVEVAS